MDSDRTQQTNTVCATGRSLTQKMMSWQHTCTHAGLKFLSRLTYSFSVSFQESQESKNTAKLVHAD